MSRDFKDYVYSIPEYILLHPEITLLQLKIYCMIRSFNDSGRIAFCSNNWLANRLDSDRVVIIRSINKLIEYGFIEKSQFNGKRLLSIRLNPVQFDDSASDLQVTPPSDLQVTPPSDLQVTVDISRNNSIREVLVLEKTKKTSPKKLKPIEYPSTYYEQKKEEEIITHIYEDNPHGLTTQSLDDYVGKVGAEKINITRWMHINNELFKCKEAGISPQDAFNLYIASDWKSFSYTYVAKEKHRNKPRNDIADWDKDLHLDAI